MIAPVNEGVLKADYDRQLFLHSCCCLTPILVKLYKLVLNIK